MDSIEMTTKSNKPPKKLRDSIIWFLDLFGLKLVVTVILVLLFVGIMGKATEAIRLNRIILEYLNEKQFLVYGDGKDGKYSIAPINSVGMLKAEKELTEEEKEMVCK